MLMHDLADFNNSDSLYYFYTFYIRVRTIKYDDVVLTLSVHMLVYLLAGELQNAVL